MNLVFGDAVLMAEPPDPLIQGQRWAIEGVAFAKGKTDPKCLLWGADTMGTSSMFSGCCYAERALNYISEGRLLQDSKLPNLSVAWCAFQVGFEFFLNCLGGKNSKCCTTP